MGWASYAPHARRSSMVRQDFLLGQSVKPSKLGKRRTVRRAARPDRKSMLLASPSRTAGTISILRRRRVYGIPTSRRFSLYDYRTAGISQCFFSSEDPLVTQEARMRISGEKGCLPQENIDIHHRQPNPRWLLAHRTAEMARSAHYVRLMACDHRLRSARNPT